MAANQNNNAKKDNTQQLQVGPDYAKLMEKQTSAIVVQACSDFLFKSGGTSLTNMFQFISNFMVLICVKYAVDDFSKFCDTFKISDTKYFRYMFQRFKYGEITYDFVKLEDGKRHFGDQIIAEDLLSQKLSSKSIHLSIEGTYYIPYKQYLIKLVNKNGNLRWYFPKSIADDIRGEYVTNCRQIEYENGTRVYRASIQNISITFTPVSQSIVCPTETYRLVGEAIKRHNLYENAIGIPPTIFTLNFQGPPGTGKTTFGTYVASVGIFDRVYTINTVKCGSEMGKFSEIVTKINRAMHTNRGVEKDKKTLDPEGEHILIIFDEIDKWLSSYIDNEISKLYDDSMKQKTSSSKDGPTIIEKTEKMTAEDESKKREKLKTEFLDSLYLLLEGQSLDTCAKYVLIFNTNNFETMFEGADVNKYYALRTRFHRYTFDPIGKRDIMYYLQYVHKKFCDYVKDETRPLHQREIAGEIIKHTYDGMYEDIPDNVSITYRELCNIIKDNADIPGIISDIKHKCRNMTPTHFTEYIDSPSVGDEFSANELD